MLEKGLLDDITDSFAYSLYRHDHLHVIERNMSLLSNARFSEDVRVLAEWKMSKEQMSKAPPIHFLKNACIFC